MASRDEINKAAVAQISRLLTDLGFDVLVAGIEIAQVALEGMISSSMKSRYRTPALLNRLPLLPAAAMSRRAAAGAGSGAEFGTGLARVGRLEDLASGVGTRVVARGFAWRGAAGAIGQRFRAVHFVEMGFVDF
jgi:hypothetical protein